MGAISLFPGGRVEVHSTSLAKIQNFSFAGDPSEKKEFRALDDSQQQLCSRLHEIFPEAKIEMSPGGEGLIVIYREGEEPNLSQREGIRSTLAAYDLAASGVAKTANPDEATVRQLADGLREL